MNKHFLTFFLILLTTVDVCATSKYMELTWNSSAKQIISGLDVMDLDGDGLMEVAISGSSDGRAYLFGHDGKLIWQKDVFAYVNSIKVGDINGDGVGEVIVGHADMSIFDITGNRTFKFNTPIGMGIYEIEIADFGDSTAKKIIFASYIKDKCQRDKPGTIYAVNGQTHETIWKYTTDQNIPQTLKIADIDGDGVDEIIVGLVYRVTGSNKVCSKKYNNPSKVLVLNSRGELIWQYDTEGGVLSIDTGDITGDGKPEIVVGGYPQLIVLDSNGNKLWENNLVINTYVEDIAVADITGDGKAEIIVASNDVHVFSHDGQLLWNGLTDSRVYSVAAGDLDGDGIPEVIAGSGSVYVFNSKGVQRFRGESHTSFGYVMAADLDGKGANEIVAGSIKTVYAYTAKAYAKRVLADELFARASIRPVTEREIAISELEQAKQIYSELSVTDKITQCLNFINKLKDTSGRTEKVSDEAYAALNMSENFILTHDYINAYRYAQQARNKFSSIQDESGKRQSDEKINKLKNTISENASNELILANESYHKSEYMQALYHAQLAKDHYSFIGDLERTEKAGLLVDNIKQIVGIPDDQVEGGDIFDFEGIGVVHIFIGLIVMALIVAIVGIIYYSIILGGKKKSKRGRKNPRLQMDDLYKVDYKNKIEKKVEPETTVPKGILNRRAHVVKYKTDDGVCGGLDFLLQKETKVVMPEKDKLTPNKGIFRKKRMGKGKKLQLFKL